MKGSRLIVAGLSAALLLAVGLSGALAANHSARRAVTVAAAKSRLGRIIVDARGRTLYLFEKDKRSRSACYGGCAKFWPPLLTHDKPAAARGAKASLLGVT